MRRAPEFLDDQESDNRLKHAECRTADADIQIMALLKIVAVPGPHIVHTVHHAIPKYLSHAPMSELVKQIREVRNRDEEQEESHVNRLWGIW